MPNINEVDTEYKSFPPFSKWLNYSVDQNRWDRHIQGKLERNEVDKDLLRRAQNIVSRTAAIESGAIEGLYEVDRGFTFTVATETALWESALTEKGSKTRALIEHQLRAYEYVLDFATQKVQINESWIRQLHENICKAQKTYMVQTEVGPQEQKLPLGEYKSLPNHVIQADNSVHAYAPVDMTPFEMHRLCEELCSEDFQNAHPVLQSSYAHYALVAIHPFSDGNGRVARALGSVFTYRSESIPLLILAEHRRIYYQVLARADSGEAQDFVDFILTRCIDAIALIDESIKAAKVPDAVEAAEAIREIYLTKGGYTHGQVDEAGKKLLKILGNAFVELKQEHENISELDIQISGGKKEYKFARENSRQLVAEPGQYLQLTLVSKPPANAQLEIQMAVEVPKDCELEDDVIINDTHGNELFSARISELIPETSTSFQMRLKIFTNRIFSELAKKLKVRAKNVLKKKGY